MTYNPPTLQALGDFWNDQGGVNLGVVGDTAHAAKGYSYHLGADQLDPTAYSIKTPRDVAGLTNAASAIDLGVVMGTYAGLRAFSVWLVAQARANAPGTSDIREVIYTADGTTVLRWDRERGYASAPRAGEADNSHLTHTHVSFYRDAEKRDHTTAFRPYFAGDSDVTITITTLPFGGKYVVKAGTAPTGIKLDAAGNVIGTKKWTATATATDVAASYDATVTVTSIRGNPFLRCTDGYFAGHLVPASAVVETPNPAPAGDCAAAVAAEHERVRATAIAAVSAL